MDIIIRNQDKTAVIKVNDFGVMCTGSARRIVSYITPEQLATLGQYSSKERCIEIINDIYNEVIRHATDGESVFIYSMPKE